MGRLIFGNSMKSILDEGYKHPCCHHVFRNYTFMFINEQNIKTSYVNKEVYHVSKK